MMRKRLYNLIACCGRGSWKFSALQPTPRVAQSQLAFAAAVAATGAGVIHWSATKQQSIRCEISHPPCKTIHFMRHGQAESNAAAYKFPPRSKEYYAAYADPQYLDALLSEVGVEQCQKAHAGLLSSPLNYQVVITSPLRRAMQTAAIAFDNFDVPRLAFDVCRETGHGKEHPCDNRRSITLNKEDFKYVDFSGAWYDEDKFVVHKDDDEQLNKRCSDFMRLLSMRPETEIAVVSHTGFLTTLFRNHLGWPADDKPFVNCEIRSVVIFFNKDGSVAHYYKIAVRKID